MPGRFSASIEVGSLRRLRDRVRRPFGGREGLEAIRALRRQPARDQASQSFTGPRGQRRRWKTRVPAFSPSTPPLRAVFAAWAGGPDGFERIRPDRVVVGVRNRYVHVHRGGRGTAINPGQVTRIPVSPAMRVAIGKKHGVWLKKTTTVLKVPARAHAGATPQLARDLEQIAARGLGL